MVQNNPTVYVVDDDEDVRESLRALLESYAFTVEDFASAEDFVLGYDGRDRGCLVLDLQLPRAGGLVIIDWLRRRMHSALPVLVVSGHGDTATKSAVLEAGGDAFLEKPFDSDRLFATIQDLSARMGRVAHNAHK